MNIRPFDPTSDRDYEQFSALYNVVWPSHHMTLERWRFQDAQLVPEFLYQRFVLEQAGEMVGIATTGQSPGSYQPGKYWLSLLVHPAVRGRGYGTTGYKHLLAFIHERADQPRKLTSFTMEDQPAGIRFLEKQGFTQVMRFPASLLDIRHFDARPFQDKVQALQDSPLVVKSLDNLLAENPDCKRDLYETMWELLQDVPQPDPLTRFSFEIWEKRMFGSPNFYPESWRLALDGADIAGMTMLWRSGKPDRLETGLTGVRRAYRRRGLATALKVMAIEFAREQGYTEIVTDNEENNPMYQLNLTLGFQPQPAMLSYEKHLIPPQNGEDGE